MKSDLIVFGEDWGGHPSSTQHLVKYLSQNRKTLWINSIGLRRPRLSFKDVKRFLHKGRAIFHKGTAQKIEGPRDVIAPRAFPWPGNPLAKLCNRLVLARQLKEKLNEHEISKPIFWTSLPTAVDVLEQFDKQAVVYYCGDDFGALDGVDHAPVLACEKRLVDQADLILAASEKLAAKFPTDKTFVLPHGVDFNLFSTPAACAPECRTKRPIAGFYGSISPWVDIALIVETALRLPDWDFMLVGPVKTDVSPLLHLPNVKLVGPKSHDQLPCYVQHWQAALLPFKDNEQIRACNPLKLREYLATPTPVATTDFPAIAPYREKLNIFSDAKGLAEILENIRPNPAQHLLVQDESWTQRAQQVDDLLGIWDCA
ncbi:glycosyltransferase family 1 protein [Terasakiella sp. SH-1]|uniref:glycosyltransferase family 1 protein n=1 Tax=Terasakiella sp. SH-1 TaxID=2560057 RepID=UPI0010747005|nr:glycosyltransferase family 1 protein [Terasakiella sp. SH-1]